tara:strand:+ start:1326 stop:1679 length:354 start_codon:yes stop_codon:yes gene_type:complete
MAYEMNPGDVAIVLRPIEEDGEWTGEISTGLAFGDDHNPDGMRAALDLAITMASAERVLEECPDIEYVFDNMKAEILQDLFPESYAEVMDEMEESKKVEVDGNVYTLNHWSKTGGSA